MTNYFNTQAGHSSAFAASRVTTVTPTGASESYDLALKIAEAADDRKGADIVLLKVANVSYLADYFVIVTGFSKAQVRAIANSIEGKVQDDLQRLPQHVEGQGDGNWVLIDYGDVIAHIFMPQEREFYDLEAFWGHAERINFAVSQLARD